MTRIFPIAQLASDQTTFDEVRTFVAEANALVLLPYDFLMHWDIEPASLPNMIDDLAVGICAWGENAAPDAHPALVCYGRGWMESGVQAVVAEESRGGIFVEQDSEGRHRLVITLE